MINRMDEKPITATVIDMEWERVHLYLTVKVDIHDASIDPEKEQLSFYLLDKNEMKSPVARSMPLFIALYKPLSSSEIILYFTPLFAKSFEYFFAISVAGRG